ncbi:MAG: hypothetical protein AAF577_13260 [Pseudomonadota bacterium]
MLRLIALVFALVTLGLILNDGYRSLAAGGWSPLSLGEVWFAVSPTSLQLLQPAVERHLHPDVWDPYMLAALTGPAFVGFGVLALIFGSLAIAFRPRRRRTLMD